VKTICRRRIHQNSGPDAFDRFTLYFRSGDGWYGASENLGQPGWSRLKFHKAAFRPEGHPSGWNAITGIRLSAWAAAPVNSAIAVDRLVALQSDIAIILSTNLGGTNPGEPKASRGAAMVVAKIMEGIGLDTDALEDTGADTGYPALYLSDTGAFLSHIVLADDLAGKRCLLAAVLGYLVPDFGGILRNTPYLIRGQLAI